MRAGLQDPVHGAQRAFRATLDALARPGRIQCLAAGDTAWPLGDAAAQVLLALADEDTPVWWQHASDADAQWLRFHTGARCTAAKREARFAIVTDVSNLPALDEFAAGTAGSPEFSTTLLIEVPSLRDGPAVHAHGPGIATREELRIAGLPAGFWAQWHANHSAYPQGVDLLFTCGADLLGLPRTSRISRLEEVACTSR